jgi:hypothetical protein
MEFFETYKIENIDDQTRIVLYFDPFPLEGILKSEEDGFPKMKIGLHSMAMGYVKKNIPTVMDAIVEVKAGVAIVTSFPYINPTPLLAK